MYLVHQLFPKNFPIHDCFCCLGNKNESKTSALIPNNKSVSEKRRKFTETIHVHVGNSTKKCNSDKKMMWSMICTKNSIY
jgi:hypothetical protein